MTARPGARALAWAAAGFLLPAAWSVGYLVARAHAPIAWGDTATLHGLWTHLSGSEYRGLPDVSLAYARRALPPTIRLALRQVPPPAWFAIPAGALAAWRARPALTAALAVDVVAMLAFVSVYRATGREDYLATVAMAAALTSAWGAAEAWRRLRDRSRARELPALAAGLGVAVVAVVALWGGINARQVSLHGDRSALDAARAALAHAPRGGTIRSDDDGLTFPLWYLRVVKHERPDVTVIDTRGVAPVIRGR